jgi:hypothetical protein
MRSALVVVVVVVLAACRPEAGPPPWAFDAWPEQRFRLEGEDTTQIDETPVSVQRFADLRLVASLTESGDTELALYVERFYMRVEGAPGGTSELAFSPEGLRSRGPQGEVSFGAEDATPGGSTMASVLASPIGGVLFTTRGEVLGTPWRSRDPVLSGVYVLDWVLVALPVVERSREPAWSGSRDLPPIGQYELGLRLPIRYTREAPPPDTARIDASGLARRAHLRMRHRVRLRCLGCAGEVNPPAPESDTPEG